MGIQNSVCIVVPRLNETSCDYIMHNCDTQFFFLAKAYYCSDKDPNVWRALYFSLGLLLLTGIIILILGLIVSNYLLYCVTNFTDLFEINHKVLSFFIIPITNSLPDLLNYQVAMRSDSVDLVLGLVIGANLLSASIVVGLISIFCPFSVKENKMIIYGFVWTLLLVSILAFVIADSKLNLLECTLMCILYFIYAWGLNFFTIQEASENIGIEAVVSNKSNVHDEHNRLVPTLHDDENSELCPHTSLSERLIDLVDCFLFLFIPISRRTLQRLKKMESPFVHTLFTSRIFHLWMVFATCVLLNLIIFQLALKWILCVTAIFYATFEIIRRYADVTCCNVLADIVSICNSLGFLSYITMVLIQLLKNMGSIWKISEYTMGLLIFSLVNSINDIIMNILLSTKLNPTLGVGSCLGTNLLLILFGIGLNGILRLASLGSFCEMFHEALPFTLNSEIYISTASLITIVLIYILYLPLNQWRFDQRIGVFGIFVWGTATVSCLILELNTDT